MEVNPDAIDPDQIELVVQPCTQIGMIMEDVSPLTLNVAREGLEDRILEIASQVRTLAALTEAVQRLIGQ